MDPRPAPAAKQAMELPRRSRQVIEWAARAGNVVRADGGVSGRRADRAVAEQTLDAADVGAAFQQMGREAVA